MVFVICICIQSIEAPFSLILKLEKLLFMPVCLINNLTIYVFISFPERTGITDLAKCNFLETLNFPMVETI